MPASGGKFALQINFLQLSLNSLQLPLVRALVTGGTGRVGSAIAARLEKEGWDVFAAGRVHGDISDVEAARAVVRTAAEELGGLDLLVHAASDGFTPKPVEEVTEED